MRVRQQGDRGKEQRGYEQSAGHGIGVVTAIKTPPTLVAWRLNLNHGCSFWDDEKDHHLHPHGVSIFACPNLERSSYSRS